MGRATKCMLHGSMGRVTRAPFTPSSEQNAMEPVTACNNCIVVTCYQARHCSRQYSNLTRKWLFELIPYCHFKDFTDSSVSLIHQSTFLSFTSSVRLQEEYEQSVCLKEESQKAGKMERQKAFQDVFAADMDHYRTHGEMQRKYNLKGSVNLWCFCFSLLFWYHNKLQNTSIIFCLTLSHLLCTANFEIIWVELRRFYSSGT